MSVTMPIRYSAVPLYEAVKLLVEQRANEIATASKKAKQLEQKLSQSSSNPITALKPCFGVVCEGDRGKRYIKASMQAQNSIDVITSWGRFKQGCFRFEDTLKAALRRGIIIRIATDKPINYQLPKWIDGLAQRYSGFKLKIISTPPVSAVCLFDNIEAAIAFTSTSPLTKGPTLWTTNTALIGLCQMYVNVVWLQRTDNSQSSLA